MNTTINESSDYDTSNCDIFGIRNVPSFLSSYDESINEDSEHFNMTSLSAFMFLSQNESKSTFGLNTGFGRDDEGFDNTRLSLAYERLHGIPKLVTQEFAPTLQILDISHNEFDNLNFMVNFKELTTLICDHNNLTSSTILPYSPKVELVWMNHCKIKELYPWVRKLQQSCPNLKYLSLMGNAAAPSYLNGGNYYEYLQYRLFVISLFPELIHLDDKAVTTKEHRQAQETFRKPILERLVAVKPTKLPNCLRQLIREILKRKRPAFFMYSVRKGMFVFRNSKKRREKLIRLHSRYVF